MPLTGLDLFFWAFGLAGHVALLGVLFSRDRARHFPAFTLFIGTSVVRTLVLFWIMRHGTPQTYFYVYWSLAILDVALQLGVVYELASRVFKPLNSWAHDARRSTVSIFMTGLIVAGAIASLAAPPSSSWRQIIVIRGELFSSALMGELLVGMLVLSARIGLPWRTHSARIARGLGAYSIVDLVIAAAHSHYGLLRGAHAYSVLSHIRIAMYVACLLYWIVALCLHAPSREALPEGTRNYLTALHLNAVHNVAVFRRWNDH